MRTIYKSAEYEEFYNSLGENVKTKIMYVLQVIADEAIVHSKFVKKLVNTPYYEIRVSVGNEYRVILFSVDEADFVKSKEVYLLNGFMKKSTKDYSKQISIADRILDGLTDSSKTTDDEQQIHKEEAGSGQEQTGEDENV